MATVSEFSLGDASGNRFRSTTNSLSAWSDHKANTNDQMQVCAIQETPLKIPPRLVPVPLGQERISVKRAHWTAAVNREKYGVEIDHPWVLSKQEVLEEIKWSLTAGMSKSLFFETSNGKIEFNRNCRVRGLSQGCITNLLRPISDAVSARTQLDRFAISSNCHLPTLKSLRSWISDFLVKWKQGVSDLEFASLLQCTHVLKPLLDELMTVHTLVKSTINANAVQDFNLTNAFSKNCYYVAEQASVVEGSKSPDDGGKISQIPYSLLAISTASPIFECNQWISGKELSNCNGESDFFIEIIDDSNSMYRIRDSTHPLFGGLAMDLTGARKSVVILRRLISMFGFDSAALWSVFDKFKESELPNLCLLPSQNQSVTCPTLLFRKRLHDQIQSRCLKMTKLLVSTICEYMHFDNLLQEILDMVTISAFSEVPFQRELDDVADLAYMRRYAELMNDVFMTNFTSGLMRFKWNVEASVFRFKWNVEAREQLALESGETMRIIDLKSQIPYPLNVIITEAHMNSYNKMFHFFMELECARIRLARLRLNDLVPTAFVGRRLSIQRFELFVYLTKIVAAVSHKFHSRFTMQDILDAPSIDEATIRHDQMLIDLSHITLTDHRSAAWTKLMIRLTELSRELEADWVDEQVREIDLIKSRLTFDSCQRILNSLMAKEYANLGM